MEGMMKYKMILVLLAALFFSCESEISTGQAEHFVKFYGNYLTDQAGEVKVLDQGGYAICGTESSASHGQRMVLIVTDEFGNPLSGYPRYYTEEGMESGATSVIAIQGGSGGFLLSGFLEHPVSGSQGGHKDVYVVRTSADGEEIWKSSFGSSEDEQALHAVELIDSGYLIAGYQMKSGKSDLLIMGVTEGGDSIRLRLNYDNPYAQNVAATYLLNTGTGYTCVCTVDKTEGDGTGIRLLSFDDELSPLEQNLTGNMDEYGTCMIEQGSNQYLVMGNRTGSSGSDEVVLYSVSMNGISISASEPVATIGEQDADIRGRRIIRTADGGYAIVGTRIADGDSQIFLQFLTNDLSDSGRVTFGATGVQTGIDIGLSEDDGFVLLGTSGQGGSHMISLIKTSEAGNL
jgi:hypothetical protein